MSKKIKNSTIHTGALGESIAVTELLWNGWAPANLNQTISNSPNVDLLAIKENTKVSIQVKTSGENSKNMLQVGNGVKDKIFNTKEGPKADFIVFVRILNIYEHECYVVPVKEAERVAQLTMHDWINTNKRDGSKREGNFPLCIRFEPNKNRLDVSNYKEKWSKYLSAWHLLEGAVKDN